MLRTVAGVNDDRTFHFSNHWKVSQDPLSIFSNHWKLLPVTIVFHVIG